MLCFVANADSPANQTKIEGKDTMNWIISDRGTIEFQQADVGVANTWIN